MMAQGPEEVRVLFGIMERGSGKEMADRLLRDGVSCSFGIHGKGTAASDMMSFLGLGSREKDVLVSLGRKSAVEKCARDLINNLGSPVTGKGIMLLLSPNAVGRLFAVMLSLNAENEAADRVHPDTAKENDLKDEYSHSLIMISVNQGYTDAVMQTARRAGATGGTIVRGRLFHEEKTALALGMNLQGEREIVLILTPSANRDAIMTDVNRECGLRTEAQGIVCSLPVERAIKI